MHSTIYATIAIGFSAICVWEVVATIRSGGQEPTVTNVDPPRPPATAVATTPKLTPKQQAANEIAKADNLNLAISVARPLMADTRDEDSDGAQILALWGAGHAKWSDFNLPATKLETTHDEEEGPRLHAWQTNVRCRSDHRDSRDDVRRRGRATTG